MAQQKAQGTITIIDTTDINSIKNWYLATNASSGVDKATTGWTDTIQQMSAGKQYLWNYEQILGSGNVEISSTQPVIIGHYGVNGQNGADGNSITSIDEYYKITNSSTVTSTNPGSSGWQKNTLVVPTTDNKYLWNYQVINYSKTAAEGSYNDARIIGVYGDKGETGPTGPQGPTGPEGPQGDTGISITGTKEIYFLKRTTDNIPTAPADGVTTTSTSTAGGIWTTVVPNYIEGGIYYTSIQTTYSSGTSPKSSTATINQGLTDANAKALAAYNTSTARDTEINALQAQAKHYWWDNQGAHVAAGENTTSVNNITQGTPSTYGFNSLMTPGYLALKYQDINFAQLATNSLTFYRPATDGTTYVQGKKGMDLTADALTFYKPLAYNSSNEPTAAATLDAKGLVLSEGGLEAGTKNTTDYIYLYSTDEPTNHTININNSGDKYDWRIVAGNKFGVDKAGNLYASNATISGAINADSGEIGGFTIGDTAINTNNKASISDSTTGIRIDSVNGIGFSGVTYFNKDGTGKIGPWTLSTTALYSGSTGINNTTSGVYLGYATDNTGLNISGGSAVTTITIANSNFTKIINGTSYNTLRVAIGSNFGMDSSGNLYANGANITNINGVNITASTIGANQIAAGAITSSKLSVGAMSSDNLFLGAAMDDRTNFVANSSTDFTKHFRYYNGSANIHSFTEYAAGIYQDTITLTGSANLGIAFARMADEFNLDSTSNYTITCWAKCSSADLSLAIGLSYYNTSNTWVWRGGTNTTKFASANTWQKFTLTFKPDSDTQAICYCFTVAGGTGSETFTIRECRLEKTGVNKYITDIDNNSGIIIKAINGTIDTNTITGNYIKLNADGLDIYKGGVSVAEYGDTARIGPVANNTARTVITSGSASGGMDVIYRNGSGTDETMAHIGYASGNAASGTAITPYYSLGTRYPNKSVGNYSVVGGRNCEASGFASTAFGFESVARGLRSVAMGGYAYAYGEDGVALGRTTAYTRQTTVGYNNIPDSDSQYVFIVGNGLPTVPRNALTVDSSGNVNIAAGAKYKINGTALSASNVGALPSDYFIWDTYSKSITVSGGATNITMGTLTQHSGYTLRGYINQNGGYTDQWLVSYGTYGSNVVAMVYSKYSSSLTNTISCIAVWTKN